MKDNVFTVVTGYVQATEEKFKSVVAVHLALQTRQINIELAGEKFTLFYFHNVKAGAGRHVNFNCLARAPFPIEEGMTWVELDKGTLYVTGRKGYYRLPSGKRTN